MLLLVVVEFFLLFLLVAFVFPVRGCVLRFVPRVGAGERADQRAGCAVACFASQGVAAKGACCAAGEAAHDASIAFRVAAAVVLVLVALVVGVAAGVGGMGGGGGILLVLRRGLAVSWTSGILMCLLSSLVHRVLVLAVALLLSGSIVRSCFAAMILLVTLRLTVTSAILVCVTATGGVVVLLLVVSVVRHDVKLQIGLCWESCVL